jgi:single-strand selective monofunctional uracil DNA glycosylase
MKDAIAISRRLARAAGRLAFAPPVACVLNPPLYAREPHEAYLERYAKRGCEALLVGMNPGPFGMVQTGVPFGEVGLVRDWLGIEGRVERPEREHPGRPILGFDCPRSEVSGARLWGWARERFGTPERFFSRFFVWNWCPLAFLEASGRNRTPNALPAREREPLEALCDRALVELTELLEPRFVVGIGRFAARRAELALAGKGLVIGSILHPSPASPSANAGWARRAEEGMEALGIRLGPRAWETRASPGVTRAPRKTRAKQRVRRARARGTRLARGGPSSAENPRPCSTS